MQLLAVSVIVVRSVSLIHGGHEVFHRPRLILQVPILQHHRVVWYHVLVVVVHIQSLGAGVEDGNQNGLVFLSIQQVERHALRVGASEGHGVGEARGHDAKEGGYSLLAGVSTTPAIVHGAIENVNETIGC